MQSANKNEGTTNNTPSRQAVARDGAVLPMGFGRFRVAAQWVTPVLHWTYRNTTKSSYAFFSCFAELCLGPVDEIVQVYVNGKPYHGVFADRADYPGTDYLESVLAKETPETFRFYWGLETQSGLTAYVQSLIKSAGHSEASKTHPNYLGRVVMGVQDMEAGQTFNGQTPQLPNVEVEFYRRSPTAYSLGGIAWGTHPIGVIKDLLTDQRGGLGLPASLFDATHWSDAMDRFVTDGAAGKTGTDLYISPLLGEQREAGQIVTDVLSYFDGLVRQRNGKIEIDWQPNDGTTTSSAGLRELSHHDMTADPQLDAQGVEDMVTQVAVTGLDYAADVPLTEATEAAQVPYAREIIGEPRTQKIDRPWFVNREQIRGYAQTIAAARSSPAISGKVKVRRESAMQPDDVTPLRPGDRFNLDYAPRSLDIVCRITERVDSDDRAEVELKFQSERGASPEPYVPAFDPRAEIAPPAPPALTRYAVAQVPFELLPDGSNYATALVERPSTNCASFETQFAPTNSWPGQTIDPSNSRWAVGAIIASTLSAGTSDTTITVGTVGEEFALFDSMGTLEQNDDTLLLYSAGEWMSVGTITPAGGGSYSLDVKRARLGSSPASRSGGSLVMLILRADVIRLANASFDEVDISGVYDTTTATKWFKLRAFNSTGYGSLTSAISLVLSDPTPSAPGGLVAIAGTGKMVQLSWDPIVGATISEYQVLRSTGPGFSDEAVIAEVTDPAYWDVDVVAGTTYRYRVGGVTPGEVFSPYSSTVDVTVTAGTGIDTTPPSDPAAATLNTSGTYFSSDGSARARLVFNLPSMPSGAVVLNLLFRRNGSTGWQIANQSSTGGSTSAIDDMTPLSSYDVACQAFSAYGYGSNIVAATSSPFTAPSDTTAPSAPTGLAVITGTGKSVSLDWDDTTVADFSEYGVYRSTSGGSYVKIAETRASRFVDVDVVLGTLYAYKITAIDRTENESGFSSIVSATPSTVPASSTDATAPGTPSAASKTSQGTYLAGDGSVLAYLDISVPGLPSLAKYQNLLYKKTSGGGDWLVAAQLTNTGSQTVRIDDLTPGISYDVAVIAFTAFAIASAITTATSSPFGAPNKSTGTSAPSSITYVAGNSSSFARPAEYLNGNTLLFSTRINWTAPTDKDVDRYEWVATSDSDAAANAASKNITKETEAIFSASTPTTVYFRVRAIDRTGNASAWAGGGTSLATVSGRPAGTMTQQNDNAVVVTGFKIGSSTAQQLIQQLARTTLSGLPSASTATFNLNISGLGFGTAPDVGFLQCYDWGLVEVRYDWDDSSSSTAVLRLRTMDGSNLPSSIVVGGFFVDLF